MTKIRLIPHILFASFLFTGNAFAASNSDVAALKEELNNIKKTYERRISDLEKQLEKTNSNIEKTNQEIAQEKAKPVANSSKTQNSGNAFNPAIGIILNGQFSSFSNRESELAGFGIGEEGERGDEGFSIGESELNFSSNIDDKFYGSLTAALVDEGGGTEVELEEAYIKTSPGLGLPQGLGVKAGRALWTVGYLNEHHAHTDDFADRPLPYRAFLNNRFNDDGMEVSYILPTNFYSEIGGGAFKGGAYPFGDGDGNAANSFYARVGGDIGEKQNWRLGASVLTGKAGARDTNEDALQFVGDSDLYIADLKYNFAPTGNSKAQELTLQGEYFVRNEKGTYEDLDAGSGAVDFDGKAKGWYLQSVYKFDPKWRVGARYSELKAASAPDLLIDSAIDSHGHNPKTITGMIDWTNSEFSRVRLQYNHEKLSQGESDNQLILQYIMSFGAHGAHNY